MGVRHCLERVKNPISEGTMSLQEPFLHDNSPKNCFVVENVDTLQGTNISPKNGILKMIFLFPRWDMLIPWRVCFSSPTCFIYVFLLGPATAAAQNKALFATPLPVISKTVPWLFRGGEKVVTGCQLLNSGCPLSRGI